MLLLILLQYKYNLKKAKCQVILKYFTKSPRSFYKKLVTRNLFTFKSKNKMRKNEKKFYTTNKKCFN